MVHPQPGEINTMKKTIKLTAILSLALAFIFTSCNQNVPTSTETGTETHPTLPQEPTEAPTVPGIETGFYLLKNTANTVLYIYTEDSFCVKYSFKSKKANDNYLKEFNALDKNDPDLAEKAKALNSKYLTELEYGKLVWVQTPLTNYISAYEIELNGKKWYIYGDGKPSITNFVKKQNEDGSTEITMNSGEELISTNDKSFAWWMPDTGNYKGKNSIEEGKYLYASATLDQVTEDFTISFYISEDDSLTDLTSLTPDVTFTQDDYSFRGKMLFAEKDGWKTDTYPIYNESTGEFTGIIRAKKDDWTNYITINMI